MCVMTSIGEMSPARMQILQNGNRSGLHSVYARMSSRLVYL